MTGGTRVLNPCSARLQACLMTSPTVGSSAPYGAAETQDGMTEFQQKKRPDSETGIRSLIIADPPGNSSGWSAMMPSVRRLCQMMKVFGFAAQSASSRRA